MVLKFIVVVYYPCISCANRLYYKCSLTLSLMNIDFPFLNVLTTLGVFSVLGAFLYIGRKLQILDTLELTVEKMKNNVTVISSFMIKNHDEFDSAELETYSPFQLTDEGRKLIEDLGFEQVFATHKSDFFSFIDSEQVKLKYDVENAAIKSIHTLSSESFMDFLKVFLYNHPKRNLGNIAPTLGVYIRDAYLSEHPEITM